MTERTQRRLAAIVSADVVGYSRLMGADEVGTLATMKAHRRELWSPMIKQFGGRIVGGAGDSILVEFASAVAAVESSIAVQQGMVTRNVDLPDDKCMLLRIGVNIGEVIVDGADIYGDGVNIAARLQEIAEPGGIAISGKVQDEVAGKLETTFADDGPHDVKNIAKPVHVWRWSPDGLEPVQRPAVKQGAELSLPDKPSIAVLPFDNMSGDPEQEYFADGITEDIIAALSRFGSFFVIARNSTFTYKGQAVDVTQVGKDLGVHYVLEGSVRRAGERLRSTAQLIDAQNGNHIWAERYDGNVVDIFELQDDITARIVGALVPELDAAERAKALSRPPDDINAWILYQRAMSQVDHISADANAQATAFLRQTIERDPGFVPAYAHIAVLRAQAAVHAYTADRSTALDEAREYGVLAITRDPNDAVAHLGLGIASMFRGEGDVAIPEIETAIEINPNFARAFVWLGFAHKWCRGDTPEIEVQNYDMALRLSPRDPMRWFCLMHKGSALRVLGRLEEAVELCQRARRLPGGGFLPLIHLAVALVHAGRTEEAHEVTGEIQRQRPELTLTLVRQMLSTICPLTLEPFLFGLRAAGLPE